MKQKLNFFDKPFLDGLAYSFWLTEQAKILLPEVEKEVKLWLEAQPSSSIWISSYVAEFHEELQNCVEKFVDKIDTFLSSEKTECYMSILKYSETLRYIYFNRLSLKKSLENDGMIQFTGTEFLQPYDSFSQSELSFLKDNPTILGAFVKKVLVEDLIEKCYSSLWGKSSFGLIQKPF